jgi:thioredoxin-like negative regulator of GroEL
MTPATHEHHLNIRAAGKTYSLDFRQAFRFGYTLLRTRKFKDAASVFEAMMHLGDHDHLAAIMLAYCKAGLKDYAASNALLYETFGDGEKTRAEQLHATFVYLSLQMWPDAAEELTAMARECPDLPVICLLLGDLLVIQRRRTKAILCWRLAAKRDHDGGAVAMVARQLIASQTTSREKT